MINSVVTVVGFYCEQMKSDEFLHSNGHCHRIFRYHRRSFGWRLSKIVCLMKNKAFFRIKKECWIKVALLIWHSNKIVHICSRMGRWIWPKSFDDIHLDVCRLYVGFHLPHYEIPQLSPHKWSMSKNCQFGKNGKVQI